MFDVVRKKKVSGCAIRMGTFSLFYLKVNTLKRGKELHLIRLDLMAKPD